MSSPGPGLAGAGVAWVGAGLLEGVAAGLLGAGLAAGLLAGGVGADAGGLSWVGVCARPDDINPAHRTKPAKPTAARPTVFMPPSQQSPAVVPRPRPPPRRHARHRIHSRPSQ